MSRHLRSVDDDQRSLGSLDDAQRAEARKLILAMWAADDLQGLTEVALRLARRVPAAVIGAAREVAP